MVGKRNLLLVTLSLTLLLLVLLGVGRWQVGHTFPQTSGMLYLGGLDGPVEIRRDPWGVPHIYATTLHDAFFAQGVVHAQDRLWQMDVQRRLGLGRLSELLGERTLESDRFMRTIGIGAAARRDWAAASDEARTALQAYSDGINAYMATNPSLPLEYQLLDADWEPWEPVHSLAWVKMMQWKLNGNWEEELLRASMVERLGAEITALLLDDRLSVLYATNVVGERSELWQRASHRDRASSAWVIGGERTASGHPILANTPHFDPGIPSIWYESGLHAPGLDVVGASLPAVPAVVIGHNADIAWGMTNLLTDTQDLFIERLNAAGDAYARQGKMVPLTVYREVIHVRHDEDVALTVKATHHGPLINDVHEGLGRPVALQWQATKEPSQFIDALLALNKASTREEFLVALQQWDSPAQIFVYADRKGNIGYVTTGELPIRPALGGLLPQPGWTGEWEWQGKVPFDELPRRWNPQESYLIAANRAAFPNDYPYYTGTRWVPSFRSTRLERMVEVDDALTLDDVEAMLRDVTSLPAERVVPFLIAIESDDLIVRRAQEQLAKWNYQVEGTLPGAGIYEVTYEFIVRGMLADEFGADDVGAKLLEAYLNLPQDHLPLTLSLLDLPEHTLWDDTRTPQRETRDDILRRALYEMSEWLGRRYGDVPHEWFWHRPHTLTFDHPLGGSSAFLAHIFNRHAEMGGDHTTVYTAGFAYGNGYTVNSVPSYYQIVEAGAWENSRMLHSTGQSGHPFHPHYDDMIPPWLAVDLAPMLWSDMQTRDASEGRVLQLVGE
ncbi:MAG: penicillin acylase family protein [Chloroflexota bacterium]|nr:penicillin acylase family protein [Chloroflexota bacterium]